MSNIKKFRVSGRQDWRRFGQTRRYFAMAEYGLCTIGRWGSTPRLAKAAVREAIRARFGKSEVESV